MSDSHQKLFEGYEKGPDQKWTIPNDEDSGVYRFILAAARRARQLQSGQRPLINTTLRKPTKIAMEEIRTGAVAVEIIPEGQPWPPQPAIDGGEGVGADALDPLLGSLDAVPTEQDAASNAWSDPHGLGVPGRRTTPELDTDLGGSSERLESEAGAEMPVAFRPE